VDPTDLAIEYALQILDLVEAVQTWFLATMARSILTTGGSPWHDTTQFAYWSALRARLAQQLGEDWETVLAHAQWVLDQARAAGQGQAEQDLADLYANRPGEWARPQQTLAALGGVAADTLTALTAIPAIILRDADDVYRAALATPVATTVAGATTTRQALRDALTDFAARGVTGFTDRAGRDWTLDAYTEMAVRTGTLNAHRWGYEQTLTAAGEDLVMVTGHGYTCPLCAPWQGTVLSLTGAHQRGWHTLPSATDPGATVRVYVSATIDHARSQGLHHPNCGHSEALYLPGASTPATTAAPKDGDQKSYEASQHQRALEREIRRQKRIQAVTLPADRAHEEARQAINQARAELRRLVAEHPKLRRKPEREQIRKPSGYRRPPRTPKQGPPRVTDHQE